MKEFQSIIEKYIISYKANQSKIERRNTIRQFKEDAVEIAACAEEYKACNGRGGGAGKQYCRFSH